MVFESLNSSESAVDLQEVLGVLRPRHHAHRPHPRIPLRQDGSRLQVCELLNLVNLLTKSQQLLPLHF